MAPTVCMADFPETGNSHRRQRIQDGSISKRQKKGLKKLSIKTSEIQEMPLSHPLSPISRERCTTESYVPIIFRSSRKILTITSLARDNQWNMKRDGLLDIFIRTIALVRRNHILQKRVNALHEETQNFISSMMINSGTATENEKISSNQNCQVSSTTENNSRSSSPSMLNSRTNVESNKVSSSSEAALKLL